MAAMTTALTVFSDKENARTYFYTGHSVTKPKIVLQKRRVPSANQEIVEDVVTVLNGTADAAGTLLDSRVSFSVTVRRPKDGVAADVTSALATFRDIVAGDEFGLTVGDQRYLK